jgi:hypothetical protein
MAVSVSKTFTAEVLFASELNTNFTDITGGGIAIISPWTGNCDADGFNLTDMGNIIYREESKVTTAANQGALYCNVGGVSSLTELFFGGESNRATIPLTLKGGRQTQPTIYLTNKSGGSLAAGDLVIQDTGNNSAVTTTTSAGSTTQAFVCLETIANNASGYFLAGPGIVTMTAADAIVRGYFLKTSTTVKRATDSSSSGSGDFGIALEAASGAAETFEAFFFGTSREPDPDPLTLTTDAPSTPAVDTLYTDTIVKGWCVKGGDTSPSISDDVNVSSITDTGVGQYTFVWARAMSSANYSGGGVSTGNPAGDDNTWTDGKDGGTNPGRTTGSWIAYTFVTGIGNDDCDMIIMAVGDN